MIRWSESDLPFQPSVIHFKYDTLNYSATFCFRITLSLWRAAQMSGVALLSILPNRSKSSLWKLKLKLKLRGRSGLW